MSHDLPLENIARASAEDVAAQHLCEAIRFCTVSYADEDKVDWEQFEGFRQWLIETYSTIHKTLEYELVGRASLLYRWKGQNQKLKPCAFLAHMDVVPIENGTLDDWTHPPFDGADEAGVIWGRGASDMKNQLVALFETVETLLKEGFRPERDIYLCLGHNEEVQVGEQSGARAIAQLLQKRGIRLEFVLDEGGAVIESLPMGVKIPAAMIGLAEKGYADFLVSVADMGGHAAEPPRQTALGKLAKFLTILEKTPMKQRLISPVTLLLNALGQHMGALNRFVLTNLRLCKPLVLRILEGDRQTNALTRTTIAATMAEASPAPNVLPQRAKATLNTRILPGETAGDVEAHIKRVADKSGIPLDIELLKYSPAVEERAHTWAYQTILCCLHTICDDIIPLPYLVTGATDSREYVHITDEIYRFYPFLLNSDELAAMHATDERIRRESLAGALRFNYQFIIRVGLQNE